MVHEYFDWTNLISKDARQRMCNNVEMGIKAGKFWHNSPKFQTNWNVFATPNEDFVNLKMSFIWSCFSYMRKEVKIHNIQSWSFMTCLPGEHRDSLWHNHDHDPTTKTVSGVYYMHIPDDVTDLEMAGTELAPGGVEANGRYFAPWKTGHWMIYPGKVWHRPGILQSKQNRFIVAADLEFKEN